MFWFLPFPVFLALTYMDMYRSMFDYENSNTFSNWTIWIIFGFIIAAALTLIPVGLGALIGSNWKRQGVMDKEYPLVALRERNGAAGQWFLGTGSIEDRRYYLWYRADDGFVSGGRTECDPSVKIILINDATPPKMVTFKTVYTRPFIEKYHRWWGFNLRDGWSPQFHIPAGSIQEGYTI